MQRTGWPIILRWPQTRDKSSNHQIYPYPHPRHTPPPMQRSLNRPKTEKRWLILLTMLVIPFFFFNFEIFWTNTKVTRVIQYTHTLDLFALHICLICGLSFSLLEHLRISCRCQDPSPLSIWAWLSWEQGHSPRWSEVHLLYRLSCSSTWRQGARIREGEFRHGSQQQKITLSQDMKGGLRERTEGKKDDSMISGRKGPSHKKQNVEAGCCFKLSNSIPTPTPENTVQECHSMV